MVLEEEDALGGVPSLGGDGGAYDDVDEAFLATLSTKEKKLLLKKLKREAAGGAGGEKEEEEDGGGRERKRSRKKEKKSKGKRKVRACVRAGWRGWTGGVRTSSFGDDC